MAGGFTREPSQSEYVTITVHFGSHGPSVWLGHFRSTFKAPWRKTIRGPWRDPVLLGRDVHPDEVLATVRKALYGLAEDVNARRP